jgi:hypothetical protein
MFKSQNPLTAKGLERKEIARWAILAKRPDCREGFFRKERKEHIYRALTLRSFLIFAIFAVKKFLFELKTN